MDFLVTDDHNHDGVRLVGVRGELDMASAGELNEHLRAAVIDAIPVVLDLRECTFVDSLGISSIVRIRRQLSKLVRTAEPLAVVAPDGDGQVRRIFRLTAIDTVIPVCESPAEAERMIADATPGRHAD